MVLRRDIRKVLEMQSIYVWIILIVVMVSKLSICIVYNISIISQ